MRRSWILMTGLLFLAFGAEAAVRLAVWTGDAEVRPAADLLTAGLSRDTNVVMLERTEIERVVQEQARGNQGRDVVQAGRLLGADGLCLLERVKTAETNLLVARFVAVKPGVNVETAMQPWPVADLNGWAQAVGARLTRVLPKFQVERTNATPISILNVRHALNSAGGRAVERELSALLGLRLMSEPGVFVLERRRLGQLAWEKELAGVNEQAFWNGSWLVEGTIEPEPGQADALRVKLQLSRADSQVRLELTATGRPAQLAGLADELAVKIIRALERSPAANAWQPADEAHSYWQEAQWAWKWGLVVETAIATENCWALGLRSNDVATLRLEALQSLAPVDAGWRFTGYRVEATVPLNHEKFKPLREALDFYQDHTLQVRAREGELDARWVGLGMSMLELLSRQLQYLGQRSADRVRLGLNDEAAAWQATARQMYAGLWGDIIRTPAANQATLSERLSGCFINYVAFWYANPAELETVLRRDLANGFTVAQLQILMQRYDRRIYRRRTYLTPQGETSFANELTLTGWTPESQDKIDTMWNRLRGEFLTATNATLRLDGYLLAIDSAPLAEVPAVFERAQNAVATAGDGWYPSEIPLSHYDLLSEMTRYLRLTNAEAVAKLGSLVDRHLVRDFDVFLRTATNHKEAVLSARRDYVRPTPPEARRLLDSLFDYLQRCHVPVDHWFTVNPIDDYKRLAAFTFDEVQGYFVNARQYEPHRMESFLMGRTFSANEQARLQSTLAAYSQRVPAGGKALAGLLNDNFRLKSQLDPSGPREFVKVQTGFLDTATNHQAVSFLTLMAPYRIDPELARQLLPHVEQYRRRLGDTPEVLRVEEILRVQSMSIEELKDYLATAKEVDASRMRRYFGQRKFTAEEAMALLPSVIGLRARVGDHPMLDSAEEQLRLVAEPNERAP